MKSLQRITKSTVRLSVEALLVGVLVACGGSKDDSSSSSPPPPAAGTPTPGAPAPNAPVIVAKPDASRFLAQATFGANDAEIASVGTMGYSAWITAQFNKPLPATSHRSYIEQMAAYYDGNDGDLSSANFQESYWAKAVTGDDVLRQRATFALSQIFVISTADASLAEHTQGVASYYDMLAQHTFGNYRDLLEAVTLHPMMGIYLTSLRNQKEDVATGRVPDENYAREIMQLFSIGLHELNNDGSYRTGTPLETYDTADIQGLAKVFTGWSWYAGPNLASRTSRRFLGNDPHAERDWRPMQSYAAYHSVSEKKFLNVTIPAASTPDGPGDLKIALDALFNHPNVGPFIGKQLIQRMVTSNPSPAYVGRVAAAFNNNGAGVRGDMKAVFQAVLMDPEARTYNPASTRFGKVREPVLRLANLLRAFKATSESERYTNIGDTDNATSSLSQTPMKSPTVFNFFRPGFTPPNSAAAAAGLVAPELQLANEVSVAGYLNYIRTWIAPANRDIQLDFTAELALANDPAALVDRVNLLLMAGQMSSAVRTQIIAAVAGRALPASDATAIANARRDRVSIAVMLTMASPDYLIQK